MGTCLVRWWSVARLGCGCVRCLTVGCVCAFGVVWSALVLRLPPGCLAPRRRCGTLLGGEPQANSLSLGLL